MLKISPIMAFYARIPLPLDKYLNNVAFAWSLVAAKGNLPL